MKEGVLSVPGSLYGGQHHGAPLPGAQADICPLAVSVKSSLLTDNLAIGVSPPHTGRVIYFATRIWIIFDTAESGADGSNYTTAEFRYGASFASYTVLGSINTQDNPGAGVPVTANLIPVLMEAGKVVYAVLTRTGSGSTNFASARATLGVDFQGVRKA